MKKSLVIVGVLALALTACKVGEKPKASASDSAAAPAAAASAAKPASAAAAAKPASAAAPAPAKK